MKPQSDVRKERLAAALRENLRRRKAAKKVSSKPDVGEGDLHRAPVGGPQAATKQP
jgi:hypothetical protein